MEDEDNVGNRGLLSAPRVVIVMGPAACGKTSLGRRLAQRHGAGFVDADDLHSAEARDKMTQGIPLRDVDRWPWLACVREVIDRALDAPKAGLQLVVACSALRQSHRQRLGAERATVQLLCLVVPQSVLLHRLRTRSGHFAGPELLASQLEALEPPDPSDCVDGTLPLDHLCQLAATRWGSLG